MALGLNVLVDCPECGLSFEGSWWVEDADSMDEIAEPPVEMQECPECLHRWDMEYPGWAFFNEA